MRSPFPSLASSTVGRVAMPTRIPDETARWHEVFLNSAEAGATSSAQSSLALGHSLLVVHAICSDQEVHTLLGAASRIASRFKGLAPAGANSARFRLEVANPALGFSLDDVVLCDDLLLRMKALIETTMPGLVGQLFGPHLTGCETIIGNEQLSFTPGEPAVWTSDPALACTIVPMRQEHLHHRNLT